MEKRYYTPPIVLFPERQLLEYEPDDSDGCGRTMTTKWDGQIPDSAYSQPQYFNTYPHDENSHDTYIKQWTKWQAAIESSWHILSHHHEYNVVAAIADYYLLEQIRFNLSGFDLQKVKAITEKAITMFVELVETWDGILTEYLTMTIGGELRHHRAFRGRILSYERIEAWAHWSQIWDKFGSPDELDYLADLFEESESGDVCGTPWAQACRILKGRMLGHLGPNEFVNKSLFVDRVFSLEHNNGCFLNKLSWATEDYEAMRDVLNAHCTNPPDLFTLEVWCSDEVRNLWRTYQMEADELV